MNKLHLALTYYGINWHIVTCVLLYILLCFRRHKKKKIMFFSLNFYFDYSYMLQCDCACVHGCPCLMCACVCVWKGHREFGVWKMDRKCKIVCSHSFCFFVLLKHVCNSCGSNCTSCCLLCKPERCLINLESWIKGNSILHNCWYL